MKRLFQHYQGEIKELNGIRLKGLKCLFDNTSKEDDVILFWLETETNWLRIFIDGCYCGIDEYKLDESKNDLDDDVSFVSFDDNVKDTIIVRSKVESLDLPLITMTLGLSNDTNLILDCDLEEKCALIIETNEGILKLCKNINTCK